MPTPPPTLEAPARPWDRPASDAGPSPAAADGTGPLATAVVAPAIPASAPPRRIMAQAPLPRPDPKIEPSRPSRRAIAAGGLVAAWLLGLGVMGCRMAAGLGALRGLRRRARPIVGDGFGRAVAEAGRSLGLRSLPPVFEAPGLAGPLAGGVFRPIVALPEGMAASLDPAALRDVLIHECAHIARRDPLVGLLQRAASALFWPHPLVHRLNRRLARAREEACDDRVVRLGDPFGYARTLLRLAEGASPRAGLAHGLFGPRWSLEDRVHRILNLRGDRVMIRTDRWLKAAVAAALASASVAVAAIRPAGEAPSTIAKAPAPPEAAPAALLEGQVVDEAGAPVAGASVNALWFRKAPEDARTGPDGRFALRLVGPIRSRGLIRATADDGRRMGLVAHEEPIRSRDRPIRIVLKPSREVVVRVRDAAGSAVAGAAVEVESAEFGFLDRGETDAGGAARLRLPVDVKIEAVAALKGGVGFDYFENYRTWPSSRRDPLPAEVVLVLDGASSASLRAVASAGRPVAGLRCRPWLFRKPGKLADFNGSGSEITAATTILGHENLHVEGNGEVVRTYEQAARDVWDPKTLESTVVVATGPGDRPVPGALVQFQGSQGGRDLNARADDAGRFRIETVATDGVFLARNEAGTLAGVARLVEGTTPLKIALGPAASASGRVVDARGKVMAGRRVQLWLYTDPNPDRRATFFEHAMTDAVGRYAFAGLVPGLRCEVSTPHKETNDGSGTIALEKFPVPGPGPISIRDLDIPGEAPAAPAVPAFGAADVAGANPMPYVINRGDVEALILAIGREPAAPALVDRIEVLVRPQANWITDLGRITQLATDDAFRARADGASAAVLGRPARRP